VKKSIKLVALVLITSVAFTTSNIFADENQSTGNNPASAATTKTAENEEATADSPSAADKGATLSLTLEEALNLIETGNSSLKLTDNKIAIYEKQYEQALARHNANYAEVDEDSAKVRKLNHKKALWTLENAKYDREKQLKDVKVQVANQYQNILALQEQVKNLKLQIDNVDKYIEQLKLQINLGMGIESQIYALNAQRSGLEAALKASQNSITSSMIALKKDLGIDIAREVVLKSDLIAYKKFDDSQINERIAKAIENDYDLKRYEQDVELTEIEYDIAYYYSNGSADQLQISVEDKKATMEALPVTKEVELRKAYNSLKSLENSIKAAELAVEADKINIEVLQKKIDAGVSSSIEMIEIQNKLLNDQYTLLQNIISYMSGVSNFENSLEN